jgi:hypothetical protein
MAKLLGMTSPIVAFAITVLRGETVLRVLPGLNAIEGLIEEKLFNI